MDHLYHRRVISLAVKREIKGLRRKIERLQNHEGSVYSLRERIQMVECHFSAIRALERVIDPANWIEQDEELRWQTSD